MTPSSLPSAGSTAGDVAAQLSDLDWVRAHLSAVIASSEDAIVSKTLNGIVTSWNAAAERLFGYTAQEMMGRSILTIIPPELRHEEDRILAQIRAGQRVERFETVRVHKSGRRLEVSLAISPVLDSSGRVVGAAKAAHDISQRRAAERALAEEAQAREALARIGQAIASQVELERIVQLVTDAATQLTGAAFGAFFYNSVKDEAYWLYTLSGVDREAFANFPMPRNTEVFGPTFRGEGVVRSEDIRKDPRYGRNAPHAGMPPGHLPVCSYLAVPVKLHTGEVIGGLFFGHPEQGIFTERSERLALGIATHAAIAMGNARLFESLKEQEVRIREIAEAERIARSEAERLGYMKDEFLATLSHELRTPLNAIQGWATLLRGTRVTAEMLQRGLETIERNVRAQAQIVDDLLDMSRIVSGKIHLEIQALQLHEVVRHALDTVRQTAEAKNLTIQPVLDSGLGWVRGDANRLQQVLWNLLSNAIKFTAAGGHIRVTLTRVNSHAEIAIEDSGVGIKPEFLPYVFDRFRQADPTTTRRFGGLGLGLSIVRTLVELHGGSVRVKSEGENKGSTFVVVLPLSRVRAESTGVVREELGEAALAEVELPSLAGARVLILDDEPDGAELIARILEARGAQPTCVRTAPEAIDELRAGHFDILLSDIGMPNTDGYEFLRQVRQLDTARERPIPAIAVTAYARSEDRQRSLLAGFHMHLAKPIEARELIAGVATLLRLSR